MALVSCASKDNPTNTTPITTDTSTTLSAFKLVSDADAPNFNSSTIEPIWSSATPLAVTASAIGENFSGSSFPVTIRSVVSSQNIYFLVQYDDADENYFRQPLHFHGGDPKTPTNWDIDATTYDDGVSLIFEIIAGNTGSKTFPADGCTMLCHTTTKNFGGGLIAPPGMYSESVGRYDLWYSHAGKSSGSGFADDNVSIGIPNYQIKRDDDNNTEIYLNNVIDDNPGKEPFHVASGTNRNLNKQFFIAQESAQPFSNGMPINPATNKVWAADDIVPSYELAMPSDPTNDYFDVQAKGFYSGGKWTVKFKRKLNTGNTDNDVQFVSGNEYPFSFAVHNNNAPGNHYGAANKSFKLKLP